MGIAHKACFPVGISDWSTRVAPCSIPYCGDRGKLTTPATPLPDQLPAASPGVSALLVETLVVTRNANSAGTLVTVGNHIRFFCTCAVLDKTQVGSSIQSQPHPTDTQSNCGCSTAHETPSVQDPGGGHRHGPARFQVEY
jgi:hypothetical protein